MTTLRNAAEQALEALEAMQAYAAAEKKGLRICDETITTLRAALAEPVQEPDPSAYHGWVLRDVLFDNGEPVGHREPR
jgi:hypothetical protein